MIKMRKDYKHTKETRKKISKATKGKKKPIRTEEHKRRLSEALKGEKNPFYRKKHTTESLKKMSEASKKENLSEETLKKMSESSKGKKHTKKTKRKMSEMCKGKRNPFFGKRHTLKSKKIISNANKGKHYSSKTEFKKGKEHPMFGVRGKLHLNYGRKHSEETKKNFSLNRTGKKHPQWLGGISFEPYDQNFNRQFKKFIRERDNNTCMLCNTHRSKLKITLSVHHIDYDKLNTTKENCLSLCWSCHSKTNFNRKHWIIFFQSLLKEKYGYEY